VARFFYLHEGTGTPVVLISPGDSPAYAWHNQLSVLAAAGHSVYVVDLPGQGRTVLHDSSFGWDLPAMTGALASFMDAVHLQRTALVAGQSRRSGITGCIDGNWLRRGGERPSISEQVREAIYAVHAECLHRSRVSMATRERWASARARCWAVSLAVLRCWRLARRVRA
jgi:hypothetical protein